jgi:putative membrane protein
MLKTFTALALLATPAIVMAAPMSDSAYVMKAGASDLFEIQSAQVMMDSSDPKIHDFATMMVQDHTQSTADVKAAAMQSNVTVAPPKLMPKQARDLAALQKATGAKRDALYIKQQKMAHQEALTLHQGYATSGKSAPLQAVAAKIVPVVQHHIEMLGTMGMSGGTPGAM